MRGRKALEAAALIETVLARNDLADPNNRLREPDRLALVRVGHILRGGKKASKVTPEVRAVIVRVVRNFGDLSFAADVAGVSRQHLYRLMDEKPDFRQQIEDAREVTKGKAKAKLFELAMSGHFPALRMFLVNTCREEFGRSHDIGDGDAPSWAELVRELTTGQTLPIEAAAAMAGSDGDGAGGNGHGPGPRVH